MSDPVPARSTRLLKLDALLEDVAAKAQETRPPTIEEGALSYEQMLALALFVTTFEVYLGMRALLRERLAEEARMLSRTLLDDTARLMWLASVRDDPEELETRALRFVFDSLDHESRYARMARDIEREWADDELQRIADELEDVTRAAERKRIKLRKMPKPRDLLRSLRQERLYFWHLRASQSIHSSRIAFYARFRSGTNEKAPVQIPLESTVEEVVRVGAMAMQTFSLAVIAAADVLDWGGRDELLEYRGRIMGLSTELLDRVVGEAREPDDRKERS